jgi:CDP-4-dehydro-6-deoxyglucose reductase
VAVEDLLALYDNIDMESDPVFERVQRIRKEARPKLKYSDGWLPDPEVLMDRLQEFQHTLVQTKSALNISEHLLQETLDRLSGAREQPEAELRQAVDSSIEELNLAMHRLEKAEDRKARLFAKDVLLRLVTARIRLLPSGHEYFLNGNDSILEAGLKAGLYLDYGCTSGNCGRCKCKVVSGAIRKLREHDYVLSAKEQEDGYILACANTAISDLVIEAREAGMEEKLPHQEIRALVRRIEKTDTGLALMHVQTPRTKSLRFKAGQYVTLTAEDGSQLQSFIASCPCDGRNLQFLLQAKDNDPFTRMVFDETLARQSLLISGPHGGFLLSEDSSRPTVFIATSRGLAPIKSLLEQAITTDNAESLTLIRLGGGSGHGPVERLTRAWSETLDNFSRIILDAKASVDEVVEELLKQQTRLGEMDCYLAGQSDWLDAVSKAATEAGVKAATWRTQTVD